MICGLIAFVMCVMFVSACPDGWIEKKTNGIHMCYKFFAKQDIDSARETCQGFGGYLAMPKSKPEQDLIYTLYLSERPVFSMILLGLKKYVWDDGTLLGDWTNWKSSKSHHRDEKCVVIHSTTRKWINIPCFSGDKYDFICQAEKHVLTSILTVKTLPNTATETSSKPKSKRIKKKRVCNKFPRSCADVKGKNPRPVVTLANGFEVVCDTVTDGGGWVIMQRRVSGKIDFYRNWRDYKYGFGDVYGSFWMGLEKIHQLVFKGRHELQVEFVFKGDKYVARYANFTIDGEPENYQLQVSGFSGNCTDNLSQTHNGRPFSTKDKDNDNSHIHCAQGHRGAWWYNSCSDSDLNGMWESRVYGQGVFWEGTTRYNQSATFTEMKFRRLN